MEQQESDNLDQSNVVCVTSLLRFANDVLIPSSISSQLCKMSEIEEGSGKEAIDEKMKVRGQVAETEAQQIGNVSDNSNDKSPVSPLSNGGIRGKEKQVSGILHVLWSLHSSVYY